MKILFVNVPWMKYYVGEGDEENVAPVCGYNFQYMNGFYYGYAEGLDEIALEKIEGGRLEDEQIEDVLVVWTAQNRENENKVIGWYKKATVYRKKQTHLTLDSDRPVLTYSISCKAESATLLPPELRLLDAKEMVKGVYFETDEKVIRDIAMYTHNYGGNKLNTLFSEEDLTRESVLNFEELEMYFAKADEFLAKDLYGKAIRCFNKVIALEPELTIGYEFKGSILLSLKMYKEALEVYKKLVLLDNEDEEANYCLGLLYGLNENYDKCEAYLEKYIASHPADMNALCERGITAYHLGEKEKALRDFKIAYEAEPDHVVFAKVVAYMQSMGY